jgi:DNA-binding CsgD family transcriptional regulator
VELLGRLRERDALDQLVAAVRSGESRTLVIRGEAGIGKSALLDHVATSASGCRILRAAGVQSEMELPFASMHQLCAPMLEHAQQLPGPQRDALEIAFGMSAGTAPDRFFVGLAVLSLFSDVAGDRPLLCLVDDTQWMDRESAQALAFVARRSFADPVGLVFGARERTAEFRGLPELELEGVSDEDARALLASVIPYRLDAQVRDRIVAETGGNPLALLELPHGLSATELAGGFGMGDAALLAGHIEDRFLRRVEALPDETRSLLVVAAAEPTGDPLLVWAAAERLHIDASAAEKTEGLLTIDDRVRFRHPLVRSAAYRAASERERHAAHRALAEITDSVIDPDRRAWHLAASVAGPDEEVAAELERSAGRAQARGGLAAAAAFLERAAILTRDPRRRANRALAAALVDLHAGSFESASRLLDAAEAGSLDESQRIRLELLRGQIAFASNVGSDAPPLLLLAAQRIEGLDPALARETYLDAWGAALFAGSLATAGDIHAVSRAAMAFPREGGEPGPADLLLAGLATLVTQGREAAANDLRLASEAFLSEDVPAAENFRWGWLTTIPSNLLWDEETWSAINERQLRMARGAGALARLPIDLTAFAVLAVWRGDLDGAAVAMSEAETVTEATGTLIAPYGRMLLAAFRGHEDEACALIEATAEAATAGGQGIGVQYGRWATSILYNGLGRYQQAMVAARSASDEAPELFLSAWALPELIEAGVRAGSDAVGPDALRRLEDATSAGGTDWGLGVTARTRALFEVGDAAEGSYHEAIERLSRTRMRPELARAHLVYGEWLRREGRRIDARERLRNAYDMFIQIGMEGFAERARRELVATGIKVGTRTEEARTGLTAQEEQIARLAREGLSNPEIGMRLFITARTVKYHLSKVYTKLNITSREQLDAVLPAEPAAASE